MNCENIKKHISAFIDGQLSEKDMNSFKEHIIQCVHCAKLIEETASAVTHISQAQKHKLPVGFFTKLNQKIDDEIKKQQTALFNFIPVLKPIAALAVIIFAVGIVWELRKKPDIIQTVVIKKPQPLLEDSIRVEEEEKFDKDAKSVRGKSFAPDIMHQEVVSIKKADKEQFAPDNQKIKSRRFAPESPVSEKLSDRKGEMSVGSSVLQKKSKESEGKNIVIKQEWENIIRDIETPMQKVFKDADSWNDFLNTHVVQKSETPSISFNIYMVIAVFAGTKPTPGYDIEIVKVEETEDTIIVHYKEQSPAKGLMLLQVLTYPSHIVVVERSEKPVFFKQSN